MLRLTLACGLNIACMRSEHFCLDCSPQSASGISLRLQVQVQVQVTYTSNNLNKERQSLLRVWHRGGHRGIPGEHAEMDSVRAGLH